MNNDFILTTPVAYIMFNRPECVEKSFQMIRKAQPSELFIIADGPRDGHPEDFELCKKCREIVSEIDWDCTVYRNYAKHNMGCGRRPASGFTWVFDHVESAILLEDDCVPTISFFRFCQEMLEKYKYDEKVFSISGVNYGLISDMGADYYFSIYTNSWGWATWKRVWDLYDYDMNKYPYFLTNFDIDSYLVEPSFSRFWLEGFRDAYIGKHKDAWDYQFVFLSFLHKALCIYPNVNLIKYIGFGDHATHTIDAYEENPFVKAVSNSFEMSFPLKHPAYVYRDFKMDYLRMRDIFGVKTNGWKICSSLSDNALYEINKYSKRIIYGAGDICRDVIRLLDQNHISTFYIAVSKKKEFNEYLMGNPVKEISEYCGFCEEALVIIAAGRKYQKEMVDNLERLGFKHYITVL